MNYEVLFKCPYCQPDTAGNHTWNCPLNSYKSIAIPEVFKTYYSDSTYSTYSKDEDILESLKQSGKRLKELLGITEEDIERAIRELRRDW